MTSFKKFMLVIHRWLGLLSGLVVLILSITGCLFVFHQEISEWVRSDLYYIEQEYNEKQRLTVKQLQDKAASALDIERLPYGLTTYKDPGRNWSALSYQYQGDSWTYFGSMADYRTVYINPYNGKIAGIHNEKKDFFQIIKGIHWSLLLATPIGQPITVWSTVIFIVLLLSGVILWWPKRWDKAGRQRSFKIKWGGTWRRVNYDLHNILGFYFLILALVIAITGLYWYFPAAKKALYFMGTGEFKLPPSTETRAVSTPAASEPPESPMEITYAEAWSRYPDAYSISFAIPADSLGAISATIRPDGETYYARSTLQFDLYSGQMLDADKYTEKNTGEKLLSMNYDIHVGAIGGVPGKVIAFIASLICGSLPVTGFIIWWDRKKRQWSRNKSNIRIKKREKVLKPEHDPTELEVV